MIDSRARAAAPRLGDARSRQLNALFGRAGGYRQAVRDDDESAAAAHGFHASIGYFELKINASGNSWCEDS